MLPTTVIAGRPPLLHCRHRRAWEKPVRGRPSVPYPVRTSAGKYCDQIRGLNRRPLGDEGMARMVVYF